MEHESPTRVVASRVRELRTGRGWTAQQLADAMTRLGFKKWGRMVVTKLEIGDREAVSVAELFGLAYCLDVAPVHLLVPTDTAPGDTYRYVPTMTAHPDLVRSWVRGQDTIGEVDVRRFASQVPEAEFGPDRHGMITAAFARADMRDRLGEQGIRVAEDRDDDAGISVARFERDPDWRPEEEADGGEH